MIRKFSLLLAGALLGATSVIAVTSGLGYPGAAIAAGTSTYQQLGIFGDIFERVRSQYVTEPEDEKLIENAINGMLSALDPHSSYLNPKDFSDMRVQTRGEFGGLGIEVTMEDELVKVVSPIDDTPASKAGVLAGDKISKIDGENVRGLSLQDAVEKMRGPVNTPIVLTIIREGADKPLDITLIRDVIQVKAVKYRVEGDDVGYLKVTSFTEQTYENLEDAIKKIETQLGDKAKGYVLDLRLNPGGLLDQAVNVSDTFLDRGEIVSTRGRNDDETRRYSAR
ncbi:MAG TPA: S41 family peptidase, partial [Rhizobiaceae bacterium]|nr:S41 family peptidase [Rhizobiaceae bacterium]